MVSELSNLHYLGLVGLEYLVVEARGGRLLRPANLLDEGAPETDLPTRRHAEEVATGNASVVAICPSARSCTFLSHQPPLFAHTKNENLKVRQSGLGYF